MSISSGARRLLLELVAESDGAWDTRNIDVMFYVRGGALDVSVLEALRELEAEELVRSADLAHGTGPSWALTDAGREALA